VKKGARILLGTSSFTKEGWGKSFYPEGLSPREYLAYYATQYPTVEIDSTFYSRPSSAVVNGWNARTPDNFVFALKVPRAITHEKVLFACQPEMDEFIGVMSLLGDKLGPMVLQFPYFNRSAFKSPDEFLARLAPFLKCLPREKMFAVELRNKNWLTSQFADLLREHNVALVLQDHSWMPGYGELESKFDPITADWTYIRWLGDRKGIEQLTTTWNKEVIDRSESMRNWVDVCYRIQNRGVTIFAYANNHYSGFAPGTLKMFLNFWNAKNLPPIDMPDPGEDVSTPASATPDAFAGPDTPRNAGARKSRRIESERAETLFD
jgi:uncharacterized protein YecE (DUF72 family)